MPEEQLSDEAEWRFANYTLDLARRELRHGDEAVDIQPRAFDLLVYLARHHSRAVDKDELQDAIWPGQFITETALSRAVMKARKAVGDDATQQAIIKTVHGHGYRFVADIEQAEVNEAAEDTTTPAPIPVTAPSRPSTRKRVPLAIFAVVALAAALLLGLWTWQRPTPEPANLRVAVLPLNNATGNTELAWTRLGLMSYVSSALQANSHLSVVADGPVVNLADSMDWQGSLESAHADELVDRLRAVFGATHILGMELTNEGPALRMNYRVLGPADKIQRGTMVGEEGIQLAEGVLQGVFGALLGHRGQLPPAPLVSEDAFTNEAFARGMDLVLRGQCADAESYLELVIAAEPDEFAPRYQYASCQRILGQTAEAEELLGELIAEQRNGPPRRELAQALMTLGILYNRSGRLDPAEASHQEALTIAREVEDHDLTARVLQNLSIVEEDRGNFAQAEDYLDLAVLSYQSADRQHLPGQLYSARANLCMDRGELVQAREWLEQALTAFREAGDRRNEAMMLNNTGYLLRQLGRVEEALDYHQRSLALRSEIGDRVGVGRVYGQLSAAYETLGRYADAEEAAKQALAVARETQDRLFEGTALAQLAQAQFEQGLLDEAESNLQASRAVMVAIQDRMRTLQVDIRLAHIALARESAGQAEDTARMALQEALAADLIQPEIEARELLAKTALARGDLAGAIAAYRAGLDRLSDASWAAKEADFRVQLANAYLDGGAFDDAAPLVGSLANYPVRPDILQTQARYAAAQGDPARAVNLMEQARELSGEQWDESSEQALSRLRKQL